MITIPHYRNDVETTDWGPVIQRAMNALVDPKPDRWPDISGGVIRFLTGIYPVQTPIRLPCRNIRLIGEGGPTSFACCLQWERTGPMFIVPGKDSVENGSGLCVSNMSFRGPKGNSVLFRFENSEKYNRCFLFERIGASYFGKVFEFADGTWGSVSVTDSDLVYNGQVLTATTPGIINETNFTRCWLEKNGMASEAWSPAYAIDVLGGDNLSFYACNLAAQARALRVQRFQDLRMDGCRLEGNAGKDDSTDPVIYIRKTNGIYLQIYNRVLKAENDSGLPNHVELHECHDYEIKPMLGGVRIWRRFEPRY